MNVNYANWNNKNKSKISNRLSLFSWYDSITVDPHAVVVHIVWSFPLSLYNWYWYDPPSVVNVPIVFVQSVWPSHCRFTVRMIFPLLLFSWYDPPSIVEHLGWTSYYPHTLVEQLVGPFHVCSTEGWLSHRCYTVDKTHPQSLWPVVLIALSLLLGQLVWPSHFCCTPNGCFKMWNGWMQFVY